MVAKGQIYDACIASAELHRYFEWVRDTIPPEASGLLAEEIQTLPGTSRGASLANL